MPPIEVDGLSMKLTKTKYIFLFGLCCTLTACDRSSTSQSQAAWEARQKRSQEQFDAYDRQSKRVEEIQAKTEEQIKRMDKILDKYEEQARRKDAILDKMERDNGLKK